MKLTLAILLALNVLPTAVHGHGELVFPMSCSVDEAHKIQSGYCPHCGQQKPPDELPVAAEHTLT
eukprot:3373337-Rhodomonas_salina.1